MDSFAELIKVYRKGDGRHVFDCSRGDDVLFVVARTPHQARLAALDHWGITATKLSHNKLTERAFQHLQDRRAEESGAFTNGETAR